MLRTLVVLLVVPLSVGGCASISKKDCLAGDWIGLGYGDGANGRARTRFADHVEACAKVDVVPDEASYRRAFERGLLDYCTPEKAYSEGRNGAEYLGLCPERLQTPFLQSYLDGLDEKLLRLDIEYESARGSLEEDRIRRASLGGQPASKSLRRSIQYGESRLSSINSERLTIRSRISRWRREL